MYFILCIMRTVYEVYCTYMTLGLKSQAMEFPIGMNDDDVTTTDV